MTSRRPLVVALVVAAAGIALRVWVYVSALGRPDSDEAIVGLMARHVLHGNFTTFYWGQPYGGPQEALLTAPVFAVGGTSLLTLRVVTVLLTVVAVWLVWQVGRRLLGERTGAVAAGLFWLWPPYDVMWLVHERGFYASDVVYCLLLIWLALRIVDAPASRVRVGVLGLVLGLGFWQTAQIVPIALPLVVWTAWRAPAALRSWLVGVAGLVAGASPWLVWNLRHDWASILPRASIAQYTHSLRIFASPLLPMLLGLRAPLSGQALLPKVLLYLVYVALLVAFVVAAVRAVRTDAFVLYLIAAAFPFIWAVARRVTSETSQPIYLVILSPVIVLLCAQLLRARLAVVLLAVACAVSVVTLHRMQSWFIHDPDQFPPPTPRSLGPLVGELDRLHLHRLYGSYWVTYRLDFDTDERIIATNPPPEHVRHRAYARQVAAGRHGYVYLRAERAPAPHGRYRRLVFGPFVIFAPSPRAADMRREKSREIG